MLLYNTICILFTLAVIIAYLNYRYIKLQTTIAIMAAALFLSLILLLLGKFGFATIEQHAASVLAQINFHDLLINGMLGFLLFAGGLTLDINDLLSQKWEIIVLSTLSTIVSTLLVGGLVYLILNDLLNIHFGVVYCLLFGALISPTDPIAVLATVKEVKAPKELATILAGESLFNDGVGIVLFLTIYQVAFMNGGFSWSHVAVLFCQQAFGGIILGVLFGLFAYWLIRPIDDLVLELLVTLMITTGGYALAQSIGVSGPLAMVVAGIFIGNQGRRFMMSEKTRNSLFTFWELIDEILNVILFLLIGLELLVLNISVNEVYLGFAAIPLVLLVRFITVAVPISWFKRTRIYVPNIISILTWGGLRGGLAVAMALSIPAGGPRNIILAMTYAIVCFSIIVQGTTAKPLVRLSRKI